MATLEEWPIRKRTITTEVKQRHIGEGSPISLIVHLTGRYIYIYIYISFFLAKFSERVWSNPIVYCGTIKNTLLRSHSH